MTISRPLAAALAAGIVTLPLAGIAQDRVTTGSPNASLQSASAASASPDPAHAYLDAARVALNSNRYRAALEAARKSASISPTAAAYAVAGNAELGLREYRGAIAAFQKARAVFPSAPTLTAQQKASILGNLAAAYYANNQPVQGAAAAREARSYDASQTAYQSLIESILSARAEEMREAGKRLEAGAVLEAAAGAVPKDAVALYTMAANDYVSASPPDNKRARAAADRALAIAPNDARANYLAAVALLNDKDRKDALTYLQKANAAAKAGGDAALGAQIDAAIAEAQQR